MKAVRAAKARDVMTRRISALHLGDTLRGAAGMLLEKGIGGAPVVDRAGRPVGVLSKTDIVRYERERLAGRDTPLKRAAVRALGSLEVVSQYPDLLPDKGAARVSEWMTPRIISVAEDADLADVAREMLKRRIHRVFVRKKSGRLSGVITTIDLMRCLI